MLLNEMEIFYYVIEEQSFSKAARRLDVSKSFISKRINRLERTLKTRLISRSTRKISLTEAGENFYRYCSEVVQSAEKGYSLINELQGKPAGRLKISIPPALALNLLSPVFSQFLTKYPEVILDVKLESRLVDIIKEGYDLALRSAVLESSNLIAKKILVIKNVICATPAYLKKNKPLKKPADLVYHNCAVYSEAKYPGHIKLIKDSVEETVHLTGNFMSNHLDLAKQLVLRNHCLGVFPEFMVIKELKEKRLVRCLEDYNLPASNLYAIYPEKEFMLPRLKLFLLEIQKYFDNWVHVFT